MTKIVIWALITTALLAEQAYIGYQLHLNIVTRSTVQAQYEASQDSILILENVIQNLTNNNKGADTTVQTTSSKKRLGKNKTDPSAGIVIDSTAPVNKE